MSAQALHDGAHILLAAGIILLILTVILAVKFEIFKMLKTEITGDKKGTASDSSISHTPSVPEPVSTKKDETDIKAVKAPKVSEPDGSSTMVISSHKSVPDTDGTVVISKKKANDAPKDDYVMIENILIIHGDPDIINL